jgi:NAD(P)H-hydrate epimerase
VAEGVPDRYHLLEPRDFHSLLKMERGDVHKGNRGHLLVIAGSTGKTGAAALTAQGAIRAGAGLVTLGIPASLNPVLENKLTEAMTVPLPETKEGTLSFRAKEPIERLLEGKTALALGPGLSTHPETVNLIRAIIENCPLPLVVDADGLNAAAGALEILKPCRGRIILTPHPGEMARLTGLSTGNIQFDRIETAESFVKEYGCCLVLKGARSVVAEPGGKTYVNPTGNPALSSGGTGDVLTGLIGGFMARGGRVVPSASAGVYMHGLAADYLAELTGPKGLFASELLPPLPGLIGMLQRGEGPLKEAPPHEALRPVFG